MREENVEKNCAICILTIIMILFMCICIRIVVKNIIYDKLMLDNRFVRFWLVNDETIGKIQASGEEAEAIVGIDWEELYPFEQKDKNQFQRRENTIRSYVKQIGEIQTKIDLYTNKFLVIQQQCLLASKSLEAFFQWELNNPSKDGIIPMRNGYLAGTCPKLKEEEIDQLVENIADFKDFLEKNNISFLYANAGSNVCPYNKQMYENTFENSNENADELLSSLQKCGIDVLDFRKDMQRDDLDWYSFYYRTDHHWTTLAGLWAAGDLADKLNQDYDFLFDKSYFSTRAYDITHYDNYWLGSRGRVLTLVRAPLDDYDLIIPKFRTNFTINVPSQGLELSGDYKNVIMKMDQLEQVANYSGIDFLNKPEAYGCVNTTRYAELKLINKLHTNNPGKKILFVRDSYADYLLSYLACDVEEEDAICLQSFTGSLKAYVRETRPDIVIVLYCIDSVSPVEMKTHKHYFDFR